jgi:dTDP-4-amino-4,6-dideoxygalactose transaminase
MVSAMLDTQRIANETPVPFLDLRPSHAALRSTLLEDFGRLVDSGGFTNGAAVDLFEESFAAYCGTRECVGVASGLDALRLVLHGLGIGPGDEVIVPASTFIATLEAVSQVGALPVPVDVDPRDYTLDVEAVVAAVTPATRAVLPVHLYGQLADMPRLRELTDGRRLALLEDACQAHGAERDGVRAGAIGTAAAFSFYPGKNLGAFGDAGAVVTGNGELASSVRALREHGQRRKYEHTMVGYTARLDTIQAAVLLRKLPLLDDWNDARRNAARYYDEALAETGDLVTPYVPSGSKPVWHLYVVQTAARDQLAEFLRGRGIATGLHYPEPVHLSEAYRSLGFGRGSFPVSEELAGRALSLPIFPGISEEQLERVVSAVGDYFDRGR